MFGSGLGDAENVLEAACSGEFFVNVADVAVLLIKDALQDVDVSGGIQSWHANVLPVEKEALLKEGRSCGRPLGEKRYGNAPKDTGLLHPVVHEGLVPRSRHTHIDRLNLKVLGVNYIALELAADKVAPFGQHIYLFSCLWMENTLLA